MNEGQENRPVDAEDMTALRRVAQAAARYANSMIAPGETVVRTHLGLDDAGCHVLIQTTTRRKALQAGEDEL